MEPMPSINPNPNYIVCDMEGIASRLRSKPQVVKLLTADEEAIKNLELEIFDTLGDLVQLRRGVAQSMAVFKRQEKKYTETASQAEEWEKRALLALQMGDEKLAGEALSHQKPHADAAATLKASLAHQSKQLESLKKNLVAIEVKIFKAKSELSDMRLITCFTTTKTEIIGKNTVSSAEMSMDEVESQLEKLEADIAELEALKAKIMADSLAHQIVLPSVDAAK